MISKEECRKYVGGNLTDQQVEKLRDTLYALVEPVLDDYIESCATLKPTCKKLLSTVESHQSDKKMKATV